MTAAQVATDALNEALAEAKVVYMRHLKIARVVFRENENAREQLALAGRRGRVLSDWIVQVRQFYTNVLGDEEIRAALAEFGITAEALTAGLALVNEVEAANARQERKKGAAQAATRARNDALDALTEWDQDTYPHLERVSV